MLEENENTAFLRAIECEDFAAPNPYHYVMGEECYIGYASGIFAKLELLAGTYALTGMGPTTTHLQRKCAVDLTYLIQAIVSADDIRSV
jgi:hypothetical protein